MTRSIILRLFSKTREDQNDVKGGSIARLTAVLFPAATKFDSLIEPKRARKHNQCGIKIRSISYNMINRTLRGFNATIIIKDVCARSSAFPFLCLEESKNRVGLIFLRNIFTAKIENL